MNKKIIVWAICAIGFISCKNSEKLSDTEITTRYFNMLDTSDYSQIPVLLADSLQTQEGDYTSSYSHEDYEELLKWDAVFDPTYEVLDVVQQDNGMVKAEVSKLDTRIQFLYEKPFISNYYLSVVDGKVSKVVTEYVDFDAETFGNNRTKLLTFINDNHPELNDFLQDQTEAGGQKYLKALELYKNQPRFEIGKDLLLMHFDCKTDVDDLQAAAGLLTLMTSPNFMHVNYHAVAGTYGIQEGLYVPPNTLFKLAFDTNWTDAHERMEAAAEEVAQLATVTLEAEGDIWIAEAGQSDFSAQLVKALQKKLPQLETKKRIHIVQHSDWNEEVTTPELLDFVKKNTDYNKIPDGNTVGNGTPGFRTPGYTEWKEEVMDSKLKSVWELAVELSNQYNGKDGRYNNEAVAENGLDFSDLSEVCWMLKLEDIKDTNEFFERYAR
ncbi:hypothetical protein [Maribacter cobaltidurans]|uniref:Uncharacterized protein n=1 Tax=Maribacter cobaltidurans TaxID=1178778 RepID=A0A223VAG5_9FLAO|nr:hypothetical protein [Maribacter cobaltidurans]ASV31968.1 hypothetical protein CJ263_18070 [Maribacter cobaltidurans]GGD86111.1 hypothetical protein GCM10011412_24900 [Maribacter cobaltidurans]